MTHPPEPLEEDDGGDRPLLSVRVSVSELDDTWNGADVMLQEELATNPDEVAKAILRCALGLAQLRRDETLLALQRQIVQWGSAG